MTTKNNKDMEKRFDSDENSVNNAENKKDSTSSKGKFFAAGGGGVAAGAAAFAANESDGSETGDESASRSYQFVPGEIPICDSFEEGIGFNEKFTIAREVLGVGGAFRHNGEWYNTFYADEWNNLTDDQKQQYAGDFSSAVANHTGAEPTNDEIADFRMPWVGRARQDNEVFSRSQYADTVADESVSTGGKDEPLIEILGVESEGVKFEGMEVSIVSIDGNNVVLLDIDLDDIYDDVPSRMGMNDNILITSEEEQGNDLFASEDNNPAGTNDLPLDDLSI